MENILTEIMGYLVGGIKDLGTGIADGVSSFAKALFLDVTTTSGGTETINGLSTFGILVCVFAGIGLAVGLTRLVFGAALGLG